MATKGWHGRWQPVHQGYTVVTVPRIFLSVFLLGRVMLLTPNTYRGRTLGKYSESSPPRECQ
ncbi:hypothetical protein BGW80DRAFT_1450152 [Lactifluus volemus]|nr:hypothetical protein BGW80DRAFT_1450152 [Lactifluus volemus]